MTKLEHGIGWTKIHWLDGDRPTERDKTTLAAALAPAPAQDVEARSSADSEWQSIAQGVQDRVAEGEGFWKSCSGCYETEDGQNVHGYSHSTVFGCDLGSGCSECGGIGAVWDTTDYSKMADEMHAEMVAGDAAGSELDLNDPLASEIMGATRLHTHDHEMAYNITREVLAAIRTQPQTAFRTPAASESLSDRLLDGLTATVEGLQRELAEEAEAHKFCQESWNTVATNLLKCQKERDQALALVENAATRDVLAERRRQIEKEGWTPEHDDSHFRCEMAQAAACYAVAASPVSIEREWVSPDTPKDWPWHSSWWKPGFYRRNLVKAGALIIAEIERWDRLEAKRARSPEHSSTMGEPK